LLGRDGAHADVDVEPEVTEPRRALEVSSGVAWSPLPLPRLALPQRAMDMLSDSFWFKTGLGVGRTRRGSEDSESTHTATPRRGSESADHVHPLTDADLTALAQDLHATHVDYSADTDFALGQRPGDKDSPSSSSTWVPVSRSSHASPSRMREGGLSRASSSMSQSKVTEDDLKRKRRSLTRILHALAGRFVEVGYCQGLDRIVIHLMRAAR